MPSYEIKSGESVYEVTSENELSASELRDYAAKLGLTQAEPVDTNQGHVSSVIGSAVRGFGEIVPGVVQGVGALTGIDTLEDAGKGIRSGLHAIAPVNPLYAESVPIKLANVAGNVANVAVTGGLGGLAGKALAAKSIAAGATTVAQAAARGANATLLGTGAAQGAAAGAESADQYGIEGLNRYGNILTHAGSAVLTERLPFGLATETAAAQRLLAGAPQIGRRLAGDVASESVEEGVNKLIENTSVNMFAPEGAQTPGLLEGVDEAAAYGGAGGAMFHGLNLATGAYKTGQDGKTPATATAPAATAPAITPAPQPTPVIINGKTVATWKPNDKGITPADIELLSQDPETLRRMQEAGVIELPTFVPPVEGVDTKPLEANLQAANVAGIAPATLAALNADVITPVAVDEPGEENPVISDPVATIEEVPVADTTVEEEAPAQGVIPTITETRTSGKFESKRKVTQEGVDRVEAAKQQLRDITNNPDIVGKQRADMIENGRNLIAFLDSHADTNAPLRTDTHKGDQIALTNEDAPKGFESFIYLEGANAGATGVRMTKETRQTETEKRQKEAKDFQEGIRRVRASGQSDQMPAAKQVAPTSQRDATKPAAQEPAPVGQTPSAAPKRVSVAGAEFNVVGVNPDGTLRLSNDQGGEFDTNPGEAWTEVATTPKDRLEYTADEVRGMSRAEFIRKEIDRTEFRKKLAILNAEAAIRSKFKPAKKLPVGVSKVTALLAKPRPTADERKLIVDYRAAQRHLGASDAAEIARVKGAVWDQLNAPPVAHEPESTTPGKITPGEKTPTVADSAASVIQRDTSKPEQMTPEEFEAMRAKVIALYDKSAMPSASEAQKKAEFKVQMLEGELKRAKTLEGGSIRGVRRTRGAVKTEADLQTELDAAKKSVAEEKQKWSDNQASSDRKLWEELQRTAPEAVQGGLVYLADVDGKQRVLNKVGLPSSGKDTIKQAVRSGLPVSAAAVDAYGITLPEGYNLNKAGDLYVYTPSEAPSLSLTPEDPAESRRRELRAAVEEVESSEQKQSDPHPGFTFNEILNRKLPLFAPRAKGRVKQVIAKGYVQQGELYVYDPTAKTDTAKERAMPAKPAENARAQVPPESRTEKVGGETADGGEVAKGGAYEADFAPGDSVSFGEKFGVVTQVANGAVSIKWDSGVTDIYTGDTLGEMNVNGKPVKPETLAAKIRAKKVAVNRGRVNMSMFPGLDENTVKTVYNAALEIAARAIEAGQTIKQAIDKAVAWLKSQNIEFDDSQVRGVLLSDVTDNTVAVTPGNPTLTEINGVSAKEIFQRAKDRHGVTRSIFEAGYVLPDGSMLDFSGRADAGFERGPGNVFLAATGRDWMKDQRSVDHREIEWEGMPSYRENWESMVDFLRLGAVRVDANSGLISMHSRAKITSAQAAVLKALVTTADGAAIDLEDDLGNRASMQLDGAKWGKVNGLLTRWANGETPEFTGVIFSPATDQVRNEEVPDIANWQPEVGQMVSATVNGTKLLARYVGPSDKSGATHDIEYNWNGKPVTTTVPRVGRPVLTVADPRNYSYNQEQNTRKAGRVGIPTEVGVTLDAGDTISKVIENIAKDTALPQTLKAVARALQGASFKGVDLRIESDARRQYAGYYTYGKGIREIGLNLRHVARGGVDAVGSFIHEALHHVTLDKIHNPQGEVETQAVAALDTLRKRVKAYAASQEMGGKFDYEVGNVDEFITAVFTRPDFQDFLATIPDTFAPDTPASKFRSVLSELFRIIAQLVTGKQVAKGSVMEQSFTAALALFETPQRETQGEGVSKTYVGPNSELSQFMRDSLDTAKAMAAAGKTSEEIRAVTGWFPGKYDGKLRFEVPDAGAQLQDEITVEVSPPQIVRGDVRNGRLYPSPNGTLYVPVVDGEEFIHDAAETPQKAEQSWFDNFAPGRVKKIGGANSGTLSQVLNHPALFEAYPSLKDVEVEFRTLSDRGGDWNKDKNLIRINSGMRKESIVSILLHEAQHAIQDLEGFDPGSLPANFSDYTESAKNRIEHYNSELDALADALILQGYVGKGATLGEAKDAYRKEFGKEPNSLSGQHAKYMSREELLAETDRMAERASKAVALLKRGTSQEQYMKTTGEIEARDVQARQNFTPEQRATIAPYSSENIAKEDAIVMFGGKGVSENRAMGDAETVQRFNEQSNDIRYSPADDSETGPSLRQVSPLAAHRDVTPEAITLARRVSQQETVNAASKIIGEALAANPDPIGGRSDAFNKFRMDTSIPVSVRITGLHIIAQQINVLSKLTKDEATLATMDDLSSDAATLVGAYENDQEAFAKLKGDAEHIRDLLSNESGRALNIHNALTRLSPEGYVRRMQRKYGDAVAEVIKTNLGVSPDKVEDEIETLRRLMREGGASERSKAIAARVRVAEHRKRFMAALREHEAPTKLAEAALMRINEKLAGPQPGKPDSSPLSVLIGENLKGPVPDFVDKAVALGVTRDMAEALDAVSAKLRDEVAALDEDKAIRRLVDSFKPRSQRVRDKTDKAVKSLLSAGKLGALSHQEFLDAFGTAFGLTPITQDLKGEITRLVNDINALPEGVARLDKQQELNETLALWKGIAAKDVLMSAWYANVLSGISTQAMGAVGNTANLVLRSAMLAITNPKDAKAYFEGIANGAKEGWREAKAALKGRGAHKVSKYGDPNVINALELLRKKGPTNAAEWVAYIASAKTLTRHVFRAMQAVDALAWSTAREGYAYLAAHRALRERVAKGEILSEEEFNAEMVRSLGGGTDMVEEDMRVARESLVKKGQTADTLTVARMASEMRDARRTKEVRDASNLFSDRIVLQQEPEGSGKFVHGLINTFQRLLTPAGIPLGQLLIPFNKIVSNLFEQSLDYTPIGLLRGWVAGGHLTDIKEFSLKNGFTFKEKARVFSQMERNERAAASVFGMAAAFAAYTIAKALGDEPEEDVPFMITGWGPEDENKRKQMPKGWAPFTIKAFGKYWKYSEMPFGAMLAAAGSAMDAQRYKNMDDMSAVSRMLYILKSAAKSFAAQGVMSSVDTAFDVVLAKASDKKLSDLPVNAVKGLIPGQGLLRDMSTMFDPTKVSNDSLKSALLRDMPFAKGLGTRPELNVFGEPVTFDGLPILRRFVTAKTEHPQADYLGRNGLHIPAMDKTIEIGQYLPKGMKDRIQRRALQTVAMDNGMLTPEQNYAFNQRAGYLTKLAVERIMASNPAILNDKAREHVQKLIDRQVEIARRRAMLEAVPAE